MSEGEDLLTSYRDRNDIGFHVDAGHRFVLDSVYESTPGVGANIEN
jgi:hypothetical protein